MRIIFVDNGSSDKTLEKAQRLAEGKGKEIEFVRNESKRGKLEILYEVIGKCDPHEIIALIEGKDWLSHENVFDHLNCVYANPNIWMTYSRAISHPQYKKVSGKKLSEKSFRENQKEDLNNLREKTGLVFNGSQMIQDSDDEKKMFHLISSRSFFFFHVISYLVVPRETVLQRNRLYTCPSTCIYM